MSGALNLIKALFPPPLLYPREIVLEVTNFCNLRCRFCHFHGEGVKKTRPKGYLSRALWEKILAELADWRPPWPVNLCLHGGGEPLLHPEFREILSRASRIPHLRVGFMTNAMLLFEDLSHFLVDLPLSWIAFSVDGTRAALNDGIRRGARLEVIEKNIDFLIAYREEKKSPLPDISFNMVAYPEVEPADIEAYVARWGRHAAQIFISRFRPVSSRRLLRPEERSRITPHPCPLPFRQMVISWDGQVGLCCEDIFVEQRLGDVRRSSLLEVFNGRRARRLRIRHQKGFRETIPLCRSCDVWAAEDVLKEEIVTIEGKSFRRITRPSGWLYLPSSA